MSDTVYIAAGGPSLIGFDWGRLDRKRVVAVNMAYRELPGCELIYFSDLRFWEWHREGLTRHASPKATGQPRIRHPDVKVYRLTGVGGLETARDAIRHGNNSGYAAINVAFHLGARRIVLLGFDMRGADGIMHWHEDHPVILRERVFQKMIRYFETIDAPLRKRGVEVVNASPDSAIECFPKVSLENVL